MKRAGSGGKPVAAAIALAAALALAVLLGRASVYWSGAVIEGRPARDSAMEPLELSPAGAGPEAYGTVNVNTATAEELCELPGIGPALAQRIVSYREEHGAFGSAEELKAVQGIGDSVFAGLRDYVTAP